MLQMPYKDPEKRKEKRKEYREKNSEKLKEKNKEYEAKRREDLKQHAYDSITSNEIIDRKKWDQWCNRIKFSAKDHKHPYSDDFTSDIIFEMLLSGCFYCENIATTIDRVDSKLEHTIENCVGCCRGCNMSKGVADHSSFIRKACFRVFGEYVDDDHDIWYVNKTIPSMCDYKSKAKKKGVSFELSKEDWESLIVGKCGYCKRSPTTWFGIDRKVPSLGYVLENVVSCCCDCNLDKLEDDIESMKERNKRIANRVISGELVISKCEKVILHRGKK